MSFLTFLQSLPGAVPDVHMHPLDYVLSHVSIATTGIIAEFGVYSGGSIKKIADKFPNRHIYGFDSFVGLPHAWERPDMVFNAGAFNLDSKLPQVPNNVELVAGWFENTIPDFAKKLKEPMALLHLDCDLYSSTKTILEGLSTYIVPGTVIVFDELFNYPTFERNEVLALYEFMQDSGRKIQWIGKNGKVNLAPDRDNGYWDQPAALMII